MQSFPHCWPLPATRRSRPCSASESHQRQCRCLRCAFRQPRERRPPAVHACRTSSARQSMQIKSKSKLAEGNSDPRVLPFTFLLSLPCGPCRRPSVHAFHGMCHQPEGRGKGGRVHWQRGGRRGRRGGRGTIDRGSGASIARRFLGRARHRQCHAVVPVPVTGWVGGELKGSEGYIHLSCLAESGTAMAWRSSSALKRGPLQHRRRPSVHLSS